MYSRAGTVQVGDRLTCLAEIHRPSRDSTFDVHVPILSSATLSYSRNRLTFKITLHREIGLESLYLPKLAAKQKFLELESKRMEPSPYSPLRQLGSLIGV